MNRVFSLALVMLTIIGLSCEKAKKDQSSAGLTGSWEFTESLIDPGNGSGTWQPAPENQEITFGDDRSFSGDVGLFQDYTRYEVLNDSALKLIKADATFISLRYKLENTGLEINPQCFERCGFKFMKLQ